MSKNNTGVYNTGENNSGNWNSGYRNSGNWNSGNWNSGNWNSGYRNSGYGNSGNWNSGYGNSTNRSAGIFCSTEPTVRMFDKETNLHWDDIDHPNFYEFNLTKWIPESEMTEAEKEANEHFCVRQGYLKTYSWEEAWANFWRDTDEENRQKFLNLPNFDAEIFKEITGIDVSENSKKQELLSKADELISKANELKKQAESL